MPEGMSAKDKKKYLKAKKTCDTNDMLIQSIIESDGYDDYDAIYSLEEKWLRAYKLMCFLENKYQIKNDFLNIFQMSLANRRLLRGKDVLRLLSQFKWREHISTIWGTI